jgi:hypothetical protein
MALATKRFGSDNRIRKDRCRGDGHECQWGSRVTGSGLRGNSSLFAHRVDPIGTLAHGLVPLPLQSTRPIQHILYTRLHQALYTKLHQARIALYRDASFHVNGSGFLRGEHQATPPLFQVLEPAVSLRGW